VQTKSILYFGMLVFASIYAKVIELHDKYLQYVNKCFVNHSLFHKVSELAIMLGLAIKWAFCCCYVPITIICCVY
jgi:hypothetical protein